MPFDPSPANRLVVFLKAPQPGLVKTRLAATLGRDRAASAYRTIVDELLERISSLNEVELRYSPDNSLEQIAGWKRSEWRLSPQGDGDLGERLESAFRECFAASAERVVVIGSDCPSVTAGDIQLAWEILESHDVVLGPATDGGYWLIGLRQILPSLFRGIPWSTEKVLDETLDRIRFARLSFHLLRSLSDIDTENDWIEFLRTGRLKVT